MKSSTVQRVADEMSRSRDRSPGNRYMLAALAEEVGELAEALDRGDRQQIAVEAAQVAATALRILEEGDSTRYRVDGLVSTLVAVGNLARGLLEQRIGLIDQAFKTLRRTRTVVDIEFVDQETR